MKRLAILLIPFLFFSCKKRNTSLAFITINATIDDNSNTNNYDVYIAGNMAALGDWRPDVHRMEKNGNQWTSTIEIPKGKKVEFKFTKGTWEAEATDKNGYVPTNHKIISYSDTTINYTIHHWKDEKYKPFGGITGNVIKHEQIKPKGLDARDVLVWLPPEYEKDQNRSYPVLYVHDGQNIFDPSTSTLNRDWQIDEIADSLIKNNIIEPIIIVGIYCNPPNRRDEYSNYPLGELYQDFLIKQLKPKIDSLYRTKKDRANTAVLGSSMGGLISFIMVWEHSNIFSKAACFSPAFKFDKFDYVPEVEQYKGKKKDIELYIDNGTVDLEAYLQPGIDNMMKALKNKDYTFNWYLAEGAEHNEMAWSERVYKPLIQFFGKK